MLHREALERMSEPELSAWLRRRVRGEEANPPLSTMQVETPDDFVVLAHGATTDEAFRRRLTAAIEQGLRELARSPSLKDGPEALAAENLAAAAQRVGALGAVVPLVAIAMRGALGHADDLAPAAQRAVLIALASLQEPKKLWSPWGELWASKVPAVWPIALDGLRCCDPKAAVALVPEVVRRALDHEGFPLGLALWGFFGDPDVSTPALAAELARLAPSERARARAALEEVGATPAELESLLPAKPPLATSAATGPAWAGGPNIKEPPRWGKAA